jgi:TPR repeat protein
MSIDLTSPSVTVPLFLFGLLVIALLVVIVLMIRDLTDDGLKYSKPLNLYRRTRRKARNGDPKACVACADLLEKGIGGAPHNYNLASHYLHQAASIFASRARHGDGYAALKLAEICNHGFTFPHMSKMGDKAYRAALAINEANARQGDINGMAYAGYQYRYGLGCISDFDRAAEYLAPAAERGHPWAAKCLAELHLNGLKPKPDPMTAARLVRQAALHGDGEAIERVGDNYLTNTGEPRSREQAYFWYALAARKGRRDAMRKLEKLELMWTPKQLREVQAQMQDWMPA